MLLKTRYYLKTSLYFFLVTFLVISCKKNNIDSGIVTRVYGQVTTDLGLPADSIMVYAIGYKSTKGLGGAGLFGSLIAHETAAEVMTDTNGKFDFNFVTSGNSSVYRIRFQPDMRLENKYLIKDKVEFKVEKPGKDFLINYDQVITLHPCDITFYVKDLKHFPLTITHQSRYYYSNEIEPITDSVTTSRRIYLERNHLTSILISRKLSDTSRQVAVYPFEPATAPTSRDITIQESDFR